MYRIGLITILCAIAECANYQRYGEMTSPYPAHSTISNLYNQYSNKVATYSSDIANFPEATRYPNYNSGFNSGYSSYSTPSSYYQGSYSTPRYDQNYGQGYGNSYGQGYGQGYGSSYGQGYGQGYGQSYGQTYGQNYGQNYGGYTSYEKSFVGGGTTNYCVNRTPQNQIWVDNLMGMWYGVEVIQHLTGDARIDRAETCIVIHIAEPVDQPSTENQFFHVEHINARFRKEYRHIRLLWDEAGQNIEYSLYFRNDSAGYWQAFDGQNGTLASRHNYNQFSGTVQVLKAVNDHLVLNFCQEERNGRPAQQYTVLFSREPGSLSRWEIDAVHKMLQTKQLSIASRRLVCGNSAENLIRNTYLTVISLVLACVFSS